MSKNRLADATSPYLQQHADNPVDWHQWGDEALNLARDLQRPILLSIGYSACHWCHVMAHESFEDPETAEVMNRLYVNIKVDREERPDLDQIYQTAHQLLARRPGGWPLTVFLSPEDQMPFFAGTYFPDQARHGLPSFKNLLHSIANAYREQHVEIGQQNQALIEAMARLNPRVPEVAPILDASPLKSADAQLAESFDEQWGGFGQAPKFPHPSNLTRLLRRWAGDRLSGKVDTRRLYMVEHTLTRMALGGVNDQLGGGFYRYSVDDQWMIPHFEKMLYDNGQLLSLYADLWQISGDTLYKDTAEHTANWVVREMQSPQGGYYSSLDADSEGHEGLFYVWSKDQIRSLLTADEYQHLERYYGLDRSPNFEGRWHLHNTTSIAEINEALDSSSQHARRLLKSAKRKLFEARESRIRPGRDEKVLTSWNALMIKGMVRAGKLLQRPEFILSAQRALDFLSRELWKDGRLLATHKDGQSRLPAYLDDHAYLLDALLELLQARWRHQDLAFAINLADVLITHFRDTDNGGFFFTSDDHERLIHRPKPLSDDATPAGNGIAAFALNRLGHLLGIRKYTDAATRALHYGWQHIDQFPQAHCTLLDTLEEHLEPTETIVIRGSSQGLGRWHERASQYYAPHRFVIAIPEGEENLPGLLGTRVIANQEIVSYICSGTQCEMPTGDFVDFCERLQKSEIRRN